MMRVSLRLFGPLAYLSATLALAWVSAACGVLAQEEDQAPVIPIPWVGR